MNNFMQLAFFLSCIHLNNDRNKRFFSCIIANEKHKHVKNAVTKSLGLDAITFNQPRPPHCRNLLTSRLCSPSFQMLTKVIVEIQLKNRLLVIDPTSVKCLKTAQKNSARLCRD